MKKIIFLILITFPVNLVLSQVPIERINIKLIDGNREIITDTNSTFQIRFRQESETITNELGEIKILGKNILCDSKKYSEGVSLNNFAYLEYYKNGNWSFYFYDVNGFDLNNKLKGMYIIEIIDIRTNWKMELIFRPEFIACENVTIMHRPGKYNICSQLVTE